MNKRPSDSEGRVWYTEADGRSLINHPIWQTDVLSPGVTAPPYVNEGVTGAQGNSSGKAIPTATTTSSTAGDIQQRGEKRRVSFNEGMYQPPLFRSTNLKCLMDLQIHL